VNRRVFAVLFSGIIFFTQLCGFHLNVIAQDSVGTPLSQEELTKLEKDLTGDGLVGRIHGLNSSVGTYVFSWRDPEDFFHGALFTMVSRDTGLLKVMNSLSRHDKVRIKGRFIENDAPQKHIAVSSVEILQKNAREGENTNACIPAEVYEKSEMTALVHASLSDGNILLIDLKDIILPVYIRDNKWTKNLYRNDLIKFKYIVRSNPKRPTHLELNVDDPEPLVVLNKLVEQHGQRRTIEGSLVRFAKSPQVKFDIYAIETTDQLGNRVNYTLINFENSELFASIREKAGRVWDRYKATAVDGRNKMVNRKIHVSATGLINVVATDQANPQVVLDSVDNLKFSREICAYEEIL
jgi:hypothetical protein